MTREETWAVSLPRAQSFFREQSDVTEEPGGLFRFGTCRISLTELAPSGIGIWAARRIRLRMEGETSDVEAIYHRYFIRFLSAGG